MPKTSIIYPFHNRLEYTMLSFPALLETALSIGNELETFFVFDDQSSDGSTEFVQKLIERNQDKINFNFIRKEINSSTFQTNHAYKNTNAQYLIKVDNDIVVPSGYVQTLVDQMKLYQDIGFLMMPEVKTFPFIPESSQLKVEDRKFIGGVGIFRKIIFDQFGDIIPIDKFGGFQRFQQIAKKKKGWRCCQLTGSGNMNLDISPVYSRVHEYAKKGWARNVFWESMQSVFEPKGMI